MSPSGLQSTVAEAWMSATFSAPEEAIMDVMTKTHVRTGKLTESERPGGRPGGRGNSEYHMIWLLGQVQVIVDEA